MTKSKEEGYTNKEKSEMKTLIISKSKQSGICILCFSKEEKKEVEKDLGDCQFKEFKIPKLRFDFLKEIYKNSDDYAIALNANILVDILDW